MNAFPGITNSHQVSRKVIVHESSRVNFMTSV